jgi:hypothetical protein
LATPLGGFGSGGICGGSRLSFVNPSLCKLEVSARTLPDSTQASLQFGDPLVGGSDEFGDLAHARDRLRCVLSALDRHAPSLLVPLRRSTPEGRIG